MKIYKTDYRHFKYDMILNDKIKKNRLESSRKSRFFLFFFIPQLRNYFKDRNIRKSR